MQPKHLILIFLAVPATFWSCGKKGELSPREKEAISHEVIQTLEQYYADIKTKGLTAEFAYLDSTDDFFWLPPGYNSALPYDTVATIIRRNAALYSRVNNSFDTLSVYPLSHNLALYTGRLRSRMTDTAGQTHVYLLAETGLCIRRKEGWKLLGGQTGLLASPEASSSIDREAGLNFFAGTWDFCIWFQPDTAGAPGLTAVWNVNKGLDSSLCLTGSVLLDGSNYTREMILYNSYHRQFERTIMTNDGIIVQLHSDGWKEGRLTWEGNRLSTGQKTELREEIEKVNDRKFIARFYERRNGAWIQTQTEVLIRRSG